MMSLEASNVCPKMQHPLQKKAKSASQILQRTSFCVAELLRRAYLQRPKSFRCRFSVSATKKNLALQIFVDQYYLQRKKIFRCRISEICNEIFFCVADF